MLGGNGGRIGTTNTPNFLISSGIWSLDNQINSRRNLKWPNISLDPDAKAYLLAVEESDGIPLETGVLIAVNNFVVGCKSDGIWDAIKSCCILAGARKVQSALIPLKGTAPSKTYSTQEYYERDIGISGSGGSINTNRANNADPQNDKHVAIFVSRGFTSGSGSSYVGGYMSQTGNNFYGCGSACYYHACNSATTANNTGSGTTSNHFRGVARNNSSNFQSFVTTSSTGGSVSTYTAASVAQNSNNITVLSSAALGRISFYSIGEYLDLTLLRTRVINLINDINTEI